MPSYPANGGNATGLNPTQQFVSPTGNDNNGGTTWQTAKETIYAAVVAMGGAGTVYAAEGSAVGGPIPGQGLWVRADGLDVPGWLHIGPLRIVGCGESNGGQFMPGVSATLKGGNGSGGRTLPYIWAANLIGQPFTVESIACPEAGIGFASVLPIRLGHDFDRDSDGTMIELDVTNGTRTGTSTVFTVDIDALPGIPTGTASRTDDVVTMVIPNPGVAWLPLLGGTPFRLASSNPDFPAGDFVVTSISTEIGTVTTPSWTITYADAGADKPSAAVTGTIKTHGCQAREMIELFSNTEDFFSTMYLVTGATIDTITVNDPLITGDVNDNDIGTLSHVEFDRAGTTTVTFNNVSAPLTQRHDAGPGVLIGRNLAINPTLNGCFAQGLIGVPVIPAANRDDLRMASVLAYSGNTFASGFNTATGFNLNNHTGTYGPVVGVGQDGLGEFVYLHGTLEYPVESEAQALSLPGIRIIGGAFTKVCVDDVQTPDSFGVGANTVELYGVNPSNAFITRSGPNPILGACVGGDNWWVPGAWNAGSSKPTPWEAQHVTSWADGRMAAKHPGTVRAAGPVSARFKNIIAAPGSWTLRGSTRTLNTSDLLAPDGSQTATKIVSAGDFLSLFPNGATGDTWEVGGKFFFGCWINATGANDLASSDFYWVNTGDITFSPSTGQSNGAFKAPFAGKGWQWMSFPLNVSVVGDSNPDIEVELLLQTGATVYLWGATAYYMPPLYHNNDTYEHMGSAPAYPRYLPKGMAGTFESQKFIGHGGFGTDSANTKVVGAGSGELTLTGTGTVYLPMYDADGTTVIGWVAQLQATVNP